jgi:pyruvate/2-oxoglutarate/acetoin dehydrogenase E1 component
LLINTTHPITSLNQTQRITFLAKPKDEFPQPVRAPIRRLGAPFCQVLFSAPLEAAFSVNAENIASAAREVLQIKRSNRGRPNEH